MSFSARLSNVPVRSPPISRRMKMSSRDRSDRLLEKMLRSPAISAFWPMFMKMSAGEDSVRLSVEV